MYYTYLNSMTEQEGYSPDQNPQRPKTLTEHREEFMVQYETLRRKELDAFWTDEEGQEKIGRVYRFTTLQDKSSGLDYLSKFVLKARQAGFRIVDRTDVPFVDNQIHQFTLEGKPVSSGSPTAPPGKPSLNR
jgi:hypothetical protein